MEILWIKCIKGVYKLTNLCYAGRFGFDPHPKKSCYMYIYNMVVT